MNRSRLTAPAEHLGLLIEPPPADLRAIPGVARDPDVLILDRPLSSLRAALRERLELSGPVLLTGHQVEFFHAGVFAKNIATACLAEFGGGSGVFLSVDEDVPKSVRLALPQKTAAGVRRIEVELPGIDPRLPMESQRPAGREHWLQFFTRVASIYAMFEATPLRDYWTAWLAGDAAPLDLLDAFTRAREAIERSVGMTPLREIRVSRLSATPEFRAFAAHLMVHAPRGASAYNEAQAAYRRRHRVRSRLRPVPPLQIAADRTEVPLWISRPGEVRRRLHVERRGDAFALFADVERVGTVGRLELATCGAADRTLARLEADGWRLRPRALALSGFARLLLSDLFIHGIGGAKYDEMTEAYLSDLLGRCPGPACCVTATLRLPLAHDLPPTEELRRARWRSRDLRFNPQRYVRGVTPELLARRESLIAASSSLRERRSRDRVARRRVFDDIHRVNEEILRQDPWRPAEFDQQVAALEQFDAQRRIALDREYFVALHPREALIELADRLRSCLKPSDANERPVSPPP